jgi:hypothetical protein
MKKILFITLLVLFLSSTAFISKSEAFLNPYDQYSGKGWLALNLTTAITPEWSFTIMPWYRFEYFRSDDDPLNIFLYELFIGPNYAKRFNDFTLKCSLWYYYSLFDMTRGPQESTLSAHNIDLVPSIDYRIGKLTLSDRVIFHVKFFADNKWYTTSEDKWGNSVLLRNMVTANYGITDRFSVLIGDEVFIGIKEDKGTKGKPQGEPLYEKNGFSKNRVHLGCAYKLDPSLSISPQYIFETDYDLYNNHKLKLISHYIFVGLNYSLKLYE